MRKTAKILALVFVFSFVFIGSISFPVAMGGNWTLRWPGYIDDHYKAQPLGSGIPCLMSNRQTGWDLFEASWLIGRYVTSATGATLGQISDLVIDEANGRIVLVVLSNVQRLGAKEVAIPYSSLVRTSPNGFQLSWGSEETERGWVSGDSRMDPDAYYLAGASSTSGLYGIPSVIDSTWLSSIYSRYGQPPYWKEGKEPGATAGLYRISTVMGAAVRSTEGEEVAKVDDLVINALDGRILFLSLGDVAGKGDALVAVPFSLLSTSGENTCVLSIGKEKLAHAPAFKESDVKDRAWAENGYKFFGAQPSWTEESTR